MTRALVAVLMSAVLAGAVAAEEVAVPLRFDLAFVREALVAQIFTEPGEKATVWRDDTGCGWLLLSQPAVDVVGGRLRIVAHGEAQVGTRLGGERCLTVLAWNGFVEAFLMPGLDTAAHAVTFTVVDSNLYDADPREGSRDGPALGPREGPRAPPPRNAPHRREPAVRGVPRVAAARSAGQRGADRPSAGLAPAARGPYRGGRDHGDVQLLRRRSWPPMGNP
ncbi:MAG: hypothetical protein ACREXX_00180 [Gammaproteobacteria bacterium]